MVIIGVNTSHNATACLLRNGKILTCVSEERLSRIKNQSGMPYLAVKECLKVAGLGIQDVDYLVVNYKDPKIHTGFSAFSGEKGKIVKNERLSLGQKILSVFWFIKEQILILFPQTKYLMDICLDLFYKVFIDPKLEEILFKDIEKNLGLPKTKILQSEHHDAHVYSAFYGSDFDKNVPTLIFTLDSMGDGVCATVSIAKNGVIERIASSPSGASIGDLYTQTTAYLGMKLGEHEYKVMGLAPYANPKHFESLYTKIKDLVSVNDDLTLSTKIHSHMFYRILPKLYSYERFDNIAGALQQLTEDTLCKWISLGIEKTGIRNVVCAGGVFMNVKANQKILEIDGVQNLFITPSASDESTAIGAAYWGHIQKGGEGVESLKDLYLGGEFSDTDISKILNRREYKAFKKRKPADIEKEIAVLLASGEIVARFSGRMEFGARSLGNRSILANPERLEVISEINDQIKSRDFWMPFAPSILDEDTDKYIINKKKMKAPYMIITFDATDEGKHKLKSAMHQSDHTLRPQIVYKEWNKSYHKLIKEFKKITGIGGVLNTSFNLHGFPVVYTPEDALLVFEKSGLKYLSLGSFLISK